MVERVPFERPELAKTRHPMPRADNMLDWRKGVWVGRMDATKVN